MFTPLSETTINTVKATVPALEENKIDIVSTFYGILFERYPAFKSYFNMDRQKGGTTSENGIPLQILSLGKAIISYARHIDNLEEILSSIERICHKHVSRGIQPVQYDGVGECLLAAMKQVLGEAATEDVMNSWAEAFAFLAKTFIEIETKLKQELSEKAGYEGMIDMKIFSTENDNNTSYINFVPISHSVPPYEDGQYVAIQIMLDDNVKTMTTMRLVKKHSDLLTIRIPSLKEKATIALRNSRVGDILKVSMPCGKAFSSLGRK